MPKSALILLVDDEQANLELFCTILENEGYRTLAAKNAVEALELLESNKPDLIISDIYMPQMGGFEFYERVQAMGDLRTVPFIFLSALADRDHVRVGKELGADDYLTKPIDIDELVTTVRGKLKRAASLRSAMENEFDTLREQILSTLSHELNTPLTYIIGFSEIIGSDASQITTSELKEFANLIHHGGDRLKNLMDDFLETIQIDSGHTRMFYDSDKKTFNLRDTLVSLKNEYAPEAAAKKLGFEMELPNELYVTASCTLVRDMIGRLLSNAVKFTQTGKVSVRALREQDLATVEVFDTGCGIPQTELPKAFNKFYQVNKEKQQQQGAGLGLYIAKGLAEINHCELELSSSDGAGTKAVIKIPIL
ncbi:MAG TPA: response regulator [Candidatus Kryptonia bacterium]